jgi:DNA-binding winged helix-turn-helix (wHTH) protein
MDSSALTPLRLNGLTVDLQRGTVADVAGTTLTLRPQTAEVLKTLAARPGKLVGKDELIKAVWGGIAVTDDSLVQCIAEIRKALGDDKHEIVKTVVKRGYVLNAGAAPVIASWMTPGHRSDGTAKWRPSIVRIALAATVIASITMGAAWHFSSYAAVEPPAVAVLPFNNLSSDAK